MKRQIIIGIVMAVCMPVVAQTQSSAYQAYIARWKNVAVRNQGDYGIPASIIMAQALLESGAGQSELAREANNHFGIKCTSDWQGGSYRHDDDKANECFRLYADASESFKDHALFLQRPRYASCYEIALEDYEGWAYRLRQCGYATDPQYAPKLIKIIEDYRLDTLVSQSPSAEPLLAEQTETKEEVRAPEIAEVPYIAPLTAREERDSFFIAHTKMKCNGVYYVEAQAGDTYSNVAFRLNVRERELRENNDALGRELERGDRIYLGAKRPYAPSDRPYIWVEAGESLWSVCQREGVQSASVQRLNELPASLSVFPSRQKVYLRKLKEDVQ